MEAIKLSDDQVSILGRPCFASARIAHVLVAAGLYEDKAKKAEYEQAVFIHWASGLLEKHGEDWAVEANKILHRFVAQSKCDHDWEVSESEGVKHCTYDECQLECELTAEDYEDIRIDHDNFEVDQHFAST